jgi:hypothetical protein
MITNLIQTWNNDRLYGHTLTSLPGKLWRFSTSEKLVTYIKPEPGTSKTFLLIFERSTKIERYPSGQIKKMDTRVRFNSLLFKYTEIGFRRVVGTCLTAGACVTAAPLGFAIKNIWGQA